MADLTNPFDLVKATDLSDSQIADYFVDFPGGASLIERIKPTSRMPMIIFGGKGSGKTHLMRYLSYPLQRLRFGEGTDPRCGIAREGYLGIYFRCGGLNAQRFSGKGQSAEVWTEVFAYYMELWFGQLLLTTIQDLYSDLPAIQTPQLISDAVRLLDVPPATMTGTIRDLIQHLETLQRSADVAINNCALTRHLDIHIQATAGRLVFGLPRVLAQHCPDLHAVAFLYLIDEFENLTEPQQRYFNTLLRERQDPCTLKVGVRLYGLRTRETLSAGEENREDSEYEALRLDSELRDRPEAAQLTFATDLVCKRLLQTGYISSMEAHHFDPSAWFEVGDQDPLLQSETAILRERYKDRDPPYVVTLRRKLLQGGKAGVTPGLRSEKDIDHALENLRYPENPFIERATIFLFYRAWAHRKDLREAAAALAIDARRYAKGDQSSEHGVVLSHFHSDVAAQLLRDTKQKQRYLGFQTFVKMSAGLPRGMLTILKHVFTWSQFYGERPFKQGRISARAQTEGVSQAAEWFFSEARAPGPMGLAIREAMTHLGQLLREIRFSDKPSECSLSTFSAELTGASSSAKEILAQAVDWSMLLRIAGGQHDRNEGRVDEKYQVHPILAPRWDLPIARRGALGLAGEEVTAIFSPGSPAEFEILAKRRVAAMTAPFFGAIPNGSTPQTNLPGLTDE